jgi:predicted GIY-YIG superfamily endonuclease
MPDYQQSKIYAIKSDKFDQIYIGSTVQNLNTRFTEHKSRKDLKTCRSHLVMSYDDVHIELIENYPCNSLDELKKRESEQIKKFNCVNKQIPLRSKQEYKKIYNKIDVECPICNKILRKNNFYRHKKICI